MAFLLRFEVQISSLSIDTLIARTIWYHRKGIYVLWLLPWTPRLDARVYRPKMWEKWIHACYFGQVYYWIQSTTVISYRFEPNLKTLPFKSFHDRSGRSIKVGGYAKRSKRDCTPIRGETFDLAVDFYPNERRWWSSPELRVPDARLFMGRKVRLPSS